MFDSLEFGVMYVVPVLEGIPFVGDPYNPTLVRIKLHKPVPFPLLQFIKVFLEKGLILFGADDSVDKRDIDKESYRQGTEKV